MLCVVITPDHHLVGSELFETSYVGRHTRIVKYVIMIFMMLEGHHSNTRLLVLGPPWATRF
jgi:hypothetical protein